MFSVLAKLLKNQYTIIKYSRIFYYIKLINCTKLMKFKSLNKVNVGSHAWGRHFLQNRCMHSNMWISGRCTNQVASVFFRPAIIDFHYCTHYIRWWWPNDLHITKFHTLVGVQATRCFGLSQDIPTLIQELSIQLLSKEEVPTVAMILQQILWINPHNPKLLVCKALLCLQTPCQQYPGN